MSDPNHALTKVFFGFKPLFGRYQICGICGMDLGMVKSGVIYCTKHKGIGITDIYITGRVKKRNSCEPSQRASITHVTPKFNRKGTPGGYL